MAPTLHFQICSFNPISQLSIDNFVWETSILCYCDVVETYCMQQIAIQKWKLTDVFPVFFFFQAMVPFSQAWNLSGNEQPTLDTKY